MAGLFDTFTIAKRGLNVQQANINTTSHNISNASTTGYSRQRAVVVTSRPFGGSSRFDSITAGQVGTGAEVTTIQRIRDTFKDYQYRNQNTNTGTLDLKNQYFTQVEDVLNETSDTGIQDALSKFYSAFQSLSIDPSKSSNRTVAVQQAATVANALNQRYTKLENNKTDAQSVLKTDVSDINSTLDQINDLNKQIASVSAIGMSPNDLMDKRDNLLDDLSAKFGITITKEQDDSLDVSASDQLGIGKLVDGTNFTGTTCKRFSTIESVNYGKNPDGTDNTDQLVVTYAKLGDKSQTQSPITIDISSMTASDKDAFKKSVEETRILVADNTGTVSITDATSLKNAMFQVPNGEVGGNQSVQKNIQKSMDDLDKFAAGLAYSVNAIQTGSTDGTANTKLANNEPLFITKGAATTTDDAISAKTITINTTIQNDTTKLNCGITSVSGDKDGKRALAIANILSTKMDLTKISVTPSSKRSDFFAATGSGLGLDADKLNLTSSSTGSTLDNFYKSLISNLATDAKAVTSDLTTANNQLQVFQNNRLSESGVSLDEEAANLVQYQHAYQANAKVISTVDELLDVVINGLKK